MHNRRQLASILVALSWMLVTAKSADAAKSYKGREFPNFNFEDVGTGEKMELKDLRGKVVLIDFWATWCGPCKAEIPNIKRVYSRYKDQGFEIISISLDSDRRKFESYVRQNSMRWLHVMEGGGWGTRLAKKFGVKSIPAMYVIDKEGKCISDRARGKALERIVESALKDEPKKEADEKKEDKREPQRKLTRQQQREQAKTARELKAALNDAAKALAEAHRPVDLLVRDTRVVESLHRVLKRQLPTPSNESETREAYVEMHEKLRALRSELFVCGMLGESLLGLPENPFEDGDRSLRPFVEAADQMDIAGKAVSVMQTKLQERKSEIDDTSQSVDAMRRKIRRNDALAIRSQEDIESLATAAEDIAARCCEPWIAQLNDADQFLEPRRTKLRSVEEDLERARELASQCHELARTRRSSSSRSTDFEQAFTSLTDVLKGVEKDVRAVSGPKAKVSLPDNPFIGRRGSDLRARVRAEQELAVADDAIKSLAELIEDASGDVDGFMARIETLQKELEIVGDDEDDRQRVRHAFQGVCDEWLAYQDRLG